ncbi:golgin subfamily B member 1-like isoform X2 [Bufo bufo]|uniref:golgin subfamily B member 1-like isoform X2 n=1 Tax=Bufo bufo TaxID=8384 RepID=UPI001ABE0D59|nr:golgin subfamily B member 1-like isoform X2 [Bufo bufo]
MFSRLSGIANTVLHELSGDGEGSEHTRDPDPGPASGTGEELSEDQMERLAHYEQLVVQLKELIQQKDVEIHHKDAELQQKESQIKLEREASDAKFAKLKLQAKAKVTTLNKQIEELKRTAADQTSQEGSEAKNRNGQNESTKSVEFNKDANSKLQDNINELTRQLHESQSTISLLTKQLSESPETIAGLTKQLQDSQESVQELTKSLQEREDAAKSLQEKLELETQQLQRTLEEKNESLHSRNQVVEMLEQELQSAELQKQVLSEQFREMEKELMSLQESLDVEQKESSQQAALYKGIVEEKDILCQQLQEALDKDKDAASEIECLKSQLENAKLQLGSTPQPDLEQIRVELLGAQEELERLRAELEKEKGAQAELQQLRPELENEEGAQEELQQLRAELEREKGTQVELQQLRAELEKAKGDQEEFQQLRAQLEREKGTQEELQQLREELEKQKGAQEDSPQLKEELEKGVQEELQQLREQLEKQKGAQEELQQLRAEFEKANSAQEELQQLREQLEKQKGAQEELQQLRAEFEKANSAQEELQRVKAELEQQKETQTQMHVELERLKESNEELLVKAEGGEQDTHNRNEHDEHNMEIEGLKTELEKGKKRQDKLSRMKEELKRVKDSLEEFDHVKEEIERGQKIISELERMRKEVERIREAETEINTLQEGQQLVKKRLEQSNVESENLSGQELTREDPASGEKDLQTGEDSDAISTGSYQESVASHQVLQSTILNVQTNLVSQELVLDVAIEDLKEKQLSILMMDLLDTQEEINKLKGELPVEGNLNEPSALNEQAIEKSKYISEEADTYIQTHDSSDLKYQSINADKDNEIISLKNTVAELQNQIETITSEKAQISLKFETLVNEQTTAQKVQASIERLEIENQQLTDYESQNILLEQLKSLENESKSKDLKITALQKDLDHMNILLSERSELSKLQENQLEEKERHMESLKEILGLSQNKEVRLSEELANNEREKVLLQELLSQKTIEIQGLQESISEKDRQVEEISLSFSDKVVLLNEEKYSMSKQIKTLKEQLNSTIQDQGEGEELLQALRTENIEIHLQIEKVAKEKCHFQEMFESVQSELGELNSQLETVKLKHSESQEIIKFAQEEREVLQIKLQDQKNELLKKQKEFEELHIQLDTQMNNYVQQLQLLTEQQQSSLEVIDSLQREKTALECQLQAYLNKSEHEVELNEKGELQAQLEDHKKEIEQLKRKLQASLVSKKELNRKISKLEKQTVNRAVNQAKDFTSSVDPDVKSLVEEVSEQSIIEDGLKQQLNERESDLETCRKELAEKSAANEQFQNLIEELTLELREKSKQIESLKSEQTERPSAESPLSDAVNAEINETRIQLENRIATLEQDKEILQKKVQEVLNSRRDTIKKAQEKDRHHREQLKQQKEEFNLLQEKYEKLQLNRREHQTDEVVLEERDTQNLRPCISGKPQNSNISEHLISISISQENSEESHWGKEWVDFSSAGMEGPVADRSAILDLTVKNHEMQIEVLQSQKNELELNALQLEDKIKGHLEGITHLQDSIDQLTRELQNEREKNLNLEMQASTLKAELESHNQEISQLNEVTIRNLKEELMRKKEEIGQLHQDLEVVNVSLKNGNMLLVEKADVILSLKSQLEVQTKEYEAHHRRLEMQSLESQNKQEEEVAEAKGKQQLQRKLQAALISRKEALKEKKALKLELDTVMNLKVDLSNKLQLSEGLVNQLNVDKDTLLQKVSAQKVERGQLIAEIDKRLLENQNLEASCESLKLALDSITQDKADLRKELESLKLSQNSQLSELQEKLTDLQKEYETLLQSYENVSNETDRMKRAVETVRQEKQELFSKIKSVETEKKQVENQLEEAEQDIENMKEKMRKFAKSKQQKILELEEENERLRGELQPAVGEQKCNATDAENSRLKEEISKVHSENHSLTLKLKQIKSEKDMVAQEIELLRVQLHNLESRVQMSQLEHTSEIHEDVVIESKVETACAQLPETEEVIEEQQASVELASKYEINQQQEALEENLQMKELIRKLESDIMMKQNEIERMDGEIKALIGDKLSLKTQLTDLQSRVTNMEIENVELEKKYQIAVGDLGEVNRQKNAIELEKDELEERLMNQMAELNGSIGNFQQDAMDLQVKNDSLQKELRNLKLQLEEEKRQMERQKIEALSEAQKEYVEKLKSANRSAKGGKSQSKELQELLKEKQQEVRHLQKDCIKYQESISSLERTIKALEFEHNKCEKEKLISNDRLMKAMEDTNKAQNDLASSRVLLDDTQSEAARVLAENLKLKDEMRTITENTTEMLKRKEEDMERRLEIERDKDGKQMVNLKEKIHALQQEKEYLEASIVNLQSRMNEKDQEFKDLQGNLNQNIAKLAAFTRSMCSLQNDRDRVIEESKKWSETFTNAMQKKDIDLNDKEKVCLDLKNELLHITSQLEECKVEVTRLQTENKELVISGQTEAEAHLKLKDSLLEEKAILSSSLEEEQKRQSACQQELRLRTQEANDRRNQLDALEIEVNQIKSENENLLESVKSLEAEVQNWKLHNEQIQSDLQASKSLIEQLHRDLEQKEQDVVQLLNSRDEAVSKAVSELQDVHAIECRTLEDRLKESERGRLDMQDQIEELKTQLKAAQEEFDRSKGQLESFTKSMCSLQEERERVLSDYQQLEQRHLDAILAKDGLIQEAAAESNTLCEELRLLRSRTDDLNAQNAKLNAQLTRYRDDLKELISLKDSQLKQLLGEKLQEIEKLRHEQSNQEQQLVQEKGQREILQQELDESKLEKQRLLEEVNNLKLNVSQLQAEIGTQENQLKQAKEEMQILKDQLMQMQKELVHVQEESSRIQVEAEQRVKSAEDELSKKLQSMQHDTGILRNETETAEERVAELARDLMESEQRLLTANEEIAGLKAQLQAFKGSMRSLQDSHDLAQEEIQRLQEQLMDVSVLDTELSAVKTEKDRLSTMLSESDEQQYTLKIELKDLTKTLQAREEEITRMASELHTSQTQLQNMSKTMGNLQEDHSRLQGTLKTPRKEVERSLQSPSQRETKISNNEDSKSGEELQKVQTEVQNLHTQLSETLKQVHLKEHRIQQLNSKFSQIFEEKNALSIQLRGSNQQLRDATSRSSSLERQLQELQQKNLETLPTTDSAPGAPQEKKEPPMEADQQLLELQERYLGLKQQNTEQEQVRSVLEQQLREERQISECRIQELEENLNRLRPHDWSTSQDSAPHELSLLIETHGTASVKTRSSSLRRFLRFFLCSRTKAPLLFSVYLLFIHVLLFLCFTGHL